MKTYFFVDGDGTENVSNYMPKRHLRESFWVCEAKDSKGRTVDKITEVPKGTIEALFKIKLTWSDAPIVIEYSKAKDVYLNPIKIGTY